ncbi:MAG: acyl carrier protein [Clostridia bacterium]|nr:acyl carrier protein [Oscillospiraceae bacterium]MDY5627884.1 acyl carrier protein [Clostridia bacterium]
MTIEKIKEVLADHLDMDTSSITNETTFEDLGIDSLETVEIMMELEDEFGIEISVADVGKTVGSLVEYIDSKKE